MKWFIANLSNDRRAIAKIKNDFHNAFRYDVLLIKRSKPFNLPDGVDHIFKRCYYWYVMVVVQMPAQLVIDCNRTDENKQLLSSSFQ